MENPINPWMIWGDFPHCFWKHPNMKLSPSHFFAFRTLWVFHLGYIWPRPHAATRRGVVVNRKSQQSAELRGRCSHPVTPWRYEKHSNTMKTTVSHMLLHWMGMFTYIFTIHLSQMLVNIPVPWFGRGI